MGPVVLAGVLAGALALEAGDAGVLPPAAEAPAEAPRPAAAPVPATVLSGAATAGMALSTSQSSAVLTPTLAARVEVAHATASWAVRARVAALLPFPLQPGANLLALDLGSFVEFESGPLAPDLTLSLRLQPFSATRLVTFDWANATPPLSPEPSPVLSLDLRAGTFSAFAALRAVGRQTSLGGQPVVSFDALVGAAAAWPAWALEVRAGSFSWGGFPVSVALGHPEPAWGLAGTARLAWSLAGGVEPVLDLATYATEPGRFERLFAPPAAPASATAATVSLEGGVEAQRLDDGAIPGARLAALAGYGDLQARVCLQGTRLQAGVRLATVGHLLFGPPALGLLTTATEVAPRVSGELGADHVFEATGLTPGLMLRVLRPGVLQGGGPDGRPLLVRSPDSFQVVAPGFAVVPVLATKVSLRWDPLPEVAVRAELEATWDWNDLSLLTGLARRLAVLTRTQVLLQGRF